MSTSTQNTVVEQDAAAIGTPEIKPHEGTSTTPIQFNSSGAMLQALLTALQAVRDMMRSTNELNILQMQAEKDDVMQSYQSALDAASNDREKIKWDAYGQFASAATGLLTQAGSLGASYLAKYNSTKEQTELTKIYKMRDAYNQANRVEPQRGAGHGELLDGQELAAETRRYQECRTSLMRGDLKDVYDDYGVGRRFGRYDGRAGGATPFERAAREIESNADDRETLNGHFEAQIDRLKGEISAKNTARDSLNNYSRALNQISTEITDGNFKLISAGYDYTAQTNRADSQRWEAIRKFADDARQGFSQTVNSLGEDLRGINNTIQSLSRV